MRYDWIFFDADGTLFDYDAAESAALEGIETNVDLYARIIDLYLRVQLLETRLQGAEQMTLARCEKAASPRTPIA